jgi:hypothetical protein
VSIHHEKAAAIGRAISASSPYLRPVANGRTGWLGDYSLDPELYPDIKHERGFYVPIPPPAPFKIPGTLLPTLVGTGGGRQWTVRVLVSDNVRNEVAPTLSAESYVRLLRTDLVPFTVMPWFLATAQPEAHRAPVPFKGGSVNLAGAFGRSAVGQAALLLGRSVQPGMRPPIQAPMIIEASSPEMRAYLEGSDFLATYASWERRAGHGVGTSGSVLPVLKATADRVSFTTGIDPVLDPMEHARTIRELIEEVHRLELAASARDSETDPIPTITLTDPPGSVPDVRVAYRCPRCGQMEILQNRFDASKGLNHRGTRDCAVDIFPPYPNRIRDVQTAARPTIRQR